MLSSPALHDDVLIVHQRSDDRAGGSEAYRVRFTHSGLCRPLTLRSPRESDVQPPASGSVVRPSHLTTFGHIKVQVTEGQPGSELLA